MARSKLTKNVHKLMKQCLEDGNYQSTCYECLGIPKSTYYGWIHKGEAPDASNPYKAFSDMVKKAQARAIKSWLNIIKTAADNGNWTAAAWYLERVRPELYGKVNRIDMRSKSELEVKKQDDILEVVLEDPELSGLATELFTKLERDKEPD